MNKIKKILMTTALLCVSSGLLAGCSDGNDANTLNVVCLKRGYGADWINKAVELFEEQNPGYKVNLNMTASAQTLFEGNIKKENNVDDIYISTGVQWREVANYLLPIDDIIEQEVDGVKLKDKVSKEFKNSLYLTNTDGEKHAYRLPWTSGVGGIFYNQYLFDLYGWSVPSTYEELVALVDDIIANPKAVPGSRGETVYPFVYTGNNTDYFDYAVFTWWSQLSGTENINTFKQYTRDSKNNFDVAQNETYNNLKKATKMWDDLFGKSSPRYEKIAALTDQQADNHSAQKNFMKGKAAMMFNGDWCYNEMLNYSGEMPENFKLRIMPTPAATGATEENKKCAYSIGEDQFIVIPKSTIKPDLAKSFMKILASDTMIKTFLKEAHGFLGFNLSSGAIDTSEFDDPVMKSLITYKNVHTDSFTNFSSSPLFLNNKVDFWAGKRPFLELIGGTKTINTAFDAIKENVNTNWETWCTACGL